MKFLTAAFVALVTFAQPAPREGAVASVADKSTDFSRLSTYTWEKSGREAFDPYAHKMIVAAIDTQMGARGLRQLTAGAGDVTIRYLVTVRTDAILDKIDEAEFKNQPVPTKNVGRVVIEMRDAKNRRLWAADTVQQLGAEYAKAYKQIDPVVERLFATYPGPRK